MEIQLPKKCHFIGVGGIGMSGLAKILVQAGFTVSGSDLATNAQTDQLASMGAHIEKGHDACFIEPEMAVIYSTGIGEDNPELRAAKQLGCPLYHRSDLLELLTRTKKTVAVTGCHGKTTTTALLAHILEIAQLDPSYVVGGILNNSQTNAKWGAGEWLVIEADESDGTFLKYHPYGAIVTNIDEDHMDYFKDKAHLEKAFKQFIEHIQVKNSAFINSDDEILCQWEKEGVQGYGLSEGKRRYWAEIIKEKENLVRFHMDQEVFEGIVPLFGAHNISNVLGAFSLAYSIGIPGSVIVKGVESFLGVKRRFELKGSIQGITFMDDYAHHPTAIEATLKAMSNHSSDSIIAVFQPHRYSRMNHSMQELNRVFAFADKVIVTDIYASGEKPIAGVNIETIVEAVGNNCCYCPREQLAIELAPLLRPGDLVLTLGAGDLPSLADEILEIYRCEPPSKLKIGIISGGRSAEHEVSKLSAVHLKKGLGGDLYEGVDFFIDPAGFWSSSAYSNDYEQLIPPEILQELYSCDFVIPMLHGPYGEDGKLQGFLETLGIPYAFSGVAASSLCMDKVYAKNIAQGSNIPTVPFVDILKKEWINKPDLIKKWVNEDLSLPVFVKAVHLGSTIGVYRAASPEQVIKAIDAAFTLDNKVMIEEAVEPCREIEVVVVDVADGKFPIILPPFEIIKKEAVHDYAGKYTQEGNGVDFSPHLTPEQREQLLNGAQLLFDKLGCSGIVRIDFFIDQKGSVLFNEINPIPGLTEFSGVPKLFASLGFDMNKIMVILVKTGTKVHRKQMRVWKHAQKERKTSLLH